MQYSEEDLSVPIGRMDWVHLLPRKLSPGSAQLWSPTGGRERAFHELGLGTRRKSHLASTVPMWEGTQLDNGHHRQ